MAQSSRASNQNKNVSRTCENARAERRKEGRKKKDPAEHQVKTKMSAAHAKTQELREERKEEGRKRGQKSPRPLAAMSTTLQVGLKVTSFVCDSFPAFQEQYETSLLYHMI
eukprot:6196520-Pleurochrysis_carterae.AAC.1